MKKVLIAISALLVAVAANAQGIVQLNNRVTGDGINAPVTINGKAATSANYATLADVSAAYGGYVVGLVDATSGAVYGTTTFRADNLTRIGFVNAKDVDIGAGTKNVRVAAWTGSADAAGYAAAKAIGNKFGESSAFSATGGVAPATPTSLVGLTAFNITVNDVPEPTTLALAALGGLALVIRRRK